MTTGATSEQSKIRNRLAFLSYARADQEAVHALEQGLEALHYQIWIDRKLDGGQAWWDEILARIRACDLMIAAVSPALLESEAAAREREYARKLGKPLLPILVAPIMTDLLPPDLAPLQLIDYTQVGPLTGFHLAGALAALPAAPPLPDPAPSPPPVPVSYLSGLADRVRAQSLTVEEQLALVAMLRVALARLREHDAALELLEALRQRRDLYYSTWQAVEELLQRERAVGPIDNKSSGPGPQARLPSGTPREESAAAPPGWYPDPSRRHQFRWFDGDWTLYASDFGVVIEDPDF
ncbi:TIR domain-containing protein [Pseudonocardia sp. NPDC049154]|uniref:TIR domain-containing protein n=1 Tax=Pseudonocardia sp. NPDC049154 TaxID=3155501 RepID=UPI0033EA5C29